METDQICTKEPFQDLLAPRKLEEQLRRREGDMKEETDLCIGTKAAHSGGKDVRAGVAENRQRLRVFLGQNAERPALSRASHRDRERQLQLEMEPRASLG